MRSLAKSKLLYKLLVSIAPVLVTLLAPSHAEARIVSRQAAQDAGLTRAWFTQASLDPTTQEIVGAVFKYDTIYTLSSAGSLQAIDATTGVTRWTMRLGSPTLPAYGPTVQRQVKINSAGNERVTTRCAIVVGTTLFVLNADNGAEIISHSIAGSPSGAPVIGNDYAYAAILSGRLVGYPLERHDVPFTIASPGVLNSQPLYSDGQLIWVTQSGGLYGASARTGRPAYRFDATAPISSTPVMVDRTVYFANERGVVYAMEAANARAVWRTTVDEQVKKPLVTIGETLYVQADGPTLYALNRMTGKQQWRVAGVADFVSTSKDHVYAVSPDGALAVLDRQTGRPVGSWPAMGELSPVPNTENDRLYFVSKSGLVQCFHEAGLEKPFRHDSQGADDVKKSDEEPDDEATAPAEESAEETPDQPTEPTNPPANPFDPFAPADEEPAPDADDAPQDDPFAPSGGAGADEDDPFGF